MKLHLTDVLVIRRAGKLSPPAAPGHLHGPPIGGLIASGQRPALAVTARAPSALNAQLPRRLDLRPERSTATILQA